MWKWLESFRFAVVWMSVLMNSVSWYTFCVSRFSLSRIYWLARKTKNHAQTRIHPSILRTQTTKILIVYYNFGLVSVKVWGFWLTNLHETKYKATKKNTIQRSLGQQTKIFRERMKENKARLFVGFRVVFQCKQSGK